MSEANVDKTTLAKALEYLGDRSYLVAYDVEPNEDQKGYESWLEVTDAARSALQAQPMVCLGGLDPSWVVAKEGDEPDGWLIRRSDV